MPVHWLGSFFGATSAAETARNGVLAIARAGEPVRILPGDAPTAPPLSAPLIAKLTFLQHTPVPYGAACIHQAEPPAFESYPSSALWVGVCTFATDRIPATWIDPCNRMDEIWIPSVFHRAAFLRSGVAEHKVHVIPPAIDTQRFQPDLPSRQAQGRGFEFLSFASADRSNGWDVLLRAYLRAFRPNEEVQLLLKVRGREAEERIREFLCAEFGERSLSTIRIDSAVLPYDQVPLLYASADCLVAPSRSSAVRLPVLEAMACGVPVIATGWGALPEFVHAGNGYRIDLERTVAPDYGFCQATGADLTHRWAEPSVEHLAALLRHVVERREELKAKGTLAREAVLARCEYPVVARAIQERLGQAGATRKMRQPAAERQAPRLHQSLVSVLIPWRNGEPWQQQLEQTLQAQSYARWEAIVIADGDTLPQFADVRFRVIQAAETGISAANNQAIALARGKYIIGLDQDDWLDPHCLKTLVEALEQHEAWAAVTADEVYVYPDRQVHAAHRFRRKVAFERHLVGHPTMIRTASCPAWDPQYKCAPDADWGMRVLVDQSVGSIPQPLYYWNLHGANVSLLQSQEQRREYRQAQERVRARRMRFPTVCFVLPGLVPGDEVRYILELACRLRQEGLLTAICDQSGQWGWPLAVSEGRPFHAFAPPRLPTCVPLLDVPVWNAIPPCAEIAVATSWETPLPAVGHENFGNGVAAWFLQDWEADRPGGHLHGNPGITRLVTGSEWLQERVKQEWRQTSERIGPAYLEHAPLPTWEQVLPRYIELLRNWMDAAYPPGPTEGASEAVMVVADADLPRPNEHPIPRETRRARDAGTRSPSGDPKENETPDLLDRTPGAGERLLVRRWGALGDVLMATPAIAALREARPFATIHVQCAPHIAAFLEGWDVVDRVTADREENYTTEYDLDGVYEKREAAGECAPIALWYAQALGVPLRAGPYPVPAVPLELKAWATEKLPGGGYVACGLRSVYRPKANWKEAQWIEMAQAASQTLFVALDPEPDPALEARGIYDGPRLYGLANVIDLTGRTPTTKHLLALLERCAACVSVDTGMLHLAHAARLPLVALMAGSPGWTRLPLVGRVRAFFGAGSCAGCYGGSTCSAAMPCLAAVSGAEVASTLQDLL